MSSFTVVMLPRAALVAPLAARTPFATRVASVDARPVACSIRLPPLSSWFDASAAKVLIEPCDFVSRSPAVVRPSLALVDAAVTASSASRAAAVFDFVLPSVSRSCAIIARASSRLDFVLSSCAVIFATVALESSLIFVFVLLTMSPRTPLTVETKVLLIWRSTVVAPTPVIFGATGFAFSLT